MQGEAIRLIFSTFRGLTDISSFHANTPKSSKRKNERISYTTPPRSCAHLHNTWNFSSLFLILSRTGINSHPRYVLRLTALLRLRIMLYLRIRPVSWSISLKESIMSRCSIIWIIQTFYPNDLSSCKDTLLPHI